MNISANHHASPPISNPVNGSVEGPLQVWQVMTEVAITLQPEQKFSDAIQLMANKPFRHALVADKLGRLLGVISDRDVWRTIVRTPNWDSKTVQAIMTRDPVTVSAKSPISAAAKTMLAMRIHCLPVIDDAGKICGILTSTDLLRAFEKIQTQLEEKKCTDPLDPE